MGKNINILRRIALYQQQMQKYYEEGNQRKCHIAVQRNVLNNVYPCSERTMRRYMKTDVRKEIELQTKQYQLDFSTN